jgi:hypothetical protein
LPNFTIQGVTQLRRNQLSKPAFQASSSGLYLPVGEDIATFGVGKWGNDRFDKLLTMHTITATTTAKYDAKMVSPAGRRGIKPLVWTKYMVLSYNGYAA